MNGCPSRQILTEFLEGRRTIWEGAPLDVHVDRCPRCQSILQHLTRGDNLAWHLPEIGLLSDSDRWCRPEIPGYDVLGEGRPGGHGVVFRAIELALGRSVAIKVLRDGLYASADARSRFRTEARAIAAMSHPNIVRLLGISEVGKGLEARPALVLEWVDGGSLADRLRGTTLDEGQAARLIEAVARGVSHAHQVGVLHRDIKPGNILLAGDTLDHPRLGDFGMAKLTEHPGHWSPSTVILGTPGYMAPELASEGAATAGPPADIYALGSVLYELLTGRPPHRGGSDIETLRSVMDCEPPPPRLLRPGLSRDLENICLKCLEKDTRRRYASASELADDLGRYLRGETVRARHVGRLGRFVRTSRRNPVVTALAAVLLLSLVTGLITTTALWIEADRGRRMNRRFLVHYARIAKYRFEVRGDLEEDERRHLDGSLKQALQLLENPTGSSEEIHDEAYAALQLADILQLLKDHHGAVDVTGRSLQSLQNLMRSDPENTIYAYHYAQGCVQLSGSLGEIGEHAEEYRRLHEAIEVADRCALRKPLAYAFAESSAVWRVSLARKLARDGRAEESEALYQAALQIQRQIIGSHPENGTQYEFYANTLMFYGLDSLTCFRSIRTHVTLAAELERSMKERLAGKPAVPSSFLTSAALRLATFSVTLERVGQMELAKEACLTSLESMRAGLDSQPMNQDNRRVLARWYCDSGLLLERWKPGSATHGFRRAISLMNEVPEHDRPPVYRLDLARFIALSPDSTRSDRERALELAMSARGSAGDEFSRGVLATCYLVNDRYREALEAALKGRNSQNGGGPGGQPEVISDAVRAMALWKLGRQQEARESLRLASRGCHSAWQTSRLEWSVHDRAWRLIMDREPPPRKPPDDAPPG